MYVCFYVKLFSFSTDRTVGRQQWFSGWSENHEILCLSFCLRRKWPQNTLSRCFGSRMFGVLSPFIARLRMLWSPWSAEINSETRLNRRHLEPPFAARTFLFLPKVGNPNLGEPSSAFTEFLYWILFFFFFFAVPRSRTCMNTAPRQHFDLVITTSVSPGRKSRVAMHFTRLPGVNVSAFQSSRPQIGVST